MSQKTLSFLETTSVVKKVIIEFKEEEKKIDFENVRKKTLMRKPSAFCEFDDLILKLVIRNELEKLEKNPNY